MDKKSLAILVIASSFAGSTFANSIVNKLVAKHGSAAPSITKTHKTPKLSSGSYTDFSGTWIGKCGDNLSMYTVIENDANYISFDGDEMKIGKGLQGSYQSNDEGNMYAHSSIEWNKDRSALIMKSSDIGKENIDNSPIGTVMSTVNLAMKNGQLNMDGTVAIFEDVTEAQQPTNIHCVFSRKQ